MPKLGREFAARTKELAPMTAATTNEEIECTRKRALDGFQRCLALLSGVVARDWRHCGKAACSRRCRGFACKPESGDEI